MECIVVDHTPYVLPWSGSTSYNTELNCKNCKILKLAVELRKKRNVNNIHEITYELLKRRHNHLTTPKTETQRTGL